MIGRRIQTMLLLFTAVNIVMVPSSASSPTENNIEDVLVQLNEIRAEVRELRDENMELKSDVKELKFRLTHQENEIQQLKNSISNLESLKISAPYETNNTNNEIFHKNEGPTPRLNNPPTSCVELTSYGNTKLDGIFLVKDDTTQKIKAVFCRFGNNEPENIIEDFVGNMEMNDGKVHLRPTSCNDLWELGNTVPNFYTIQQFNKLKTVYCDFTLAAGNTVIEEFVGNIAMNDGKTNLRPASCEDLWELGNTVPNFYTIQKSNKLWTVYCDFTLAAGNTGYQKEIGYNDVKTKSIHFYVQRIYSFSGSVINFQVSRLNDGAAMNLNTGVFTCPVPGIYHFEFSAQKAKTDFILSVVLQVNEASIGMAETKLYRADENSNSISLTASLRLKANDRVRLLRINGDLLDNGDHHTHFTGWLVEEELI